MSEVFHHAEVGQAGKPRSGCSQKRVSRGGAKRTAKPHSDLDLCVVSDNPLSFTVLGALADAFSDSDLPWKVDVVDWATTSESFRKIIEQEKVVVQAGSGDA